jgi:tape measure domain-containing protein
MPVLSNLIVRIGASTDDFDKKVNASLGKIKRFGATISEAGQALSIGFSAPVIAAGAAAVNAAMQMESLEKGLAATMKSTAAAATELERLKEVSKLPGLGLKEAVQGSIRLQTLGSTADESRRIMRELGNALAVVGGGKEDFSEVIRQLSQMAAVGKVTKENLDPIVERIPQIAAIIKEKFGAAALGDPAKTFEKMGISAQQFIGVVVSELEKGGRAGGDLKTSMENLRESAEQTAAAFGKSLLPIGKRLVDEFFNPAIAQAQKLAEQFSKLSPETQDTALKFGALAVALPPVAFVLGTLIEKSATISQAFLRLAGAFGMTGSAAAVMAQAVAGAYLAFKLFEDTKALVKGIKDFAVEVDYLADVSTKAQVVIDFLREKFELLKPVLEKLKPLIEPIGAAIDKSMRLAFSPIAAAGEAYTGLGAAIRFATGRNLEMEAAIKANIGRTAEATANETQAILKKKELEAQLKRIRATYEEVGAVVVDVTDKKKKAVHVIDQLANAFQRLGVTNTTDAIGSFALARTAMERITEAYQQGKASTIDVQRAQEALGEAYKKFIVDVGGVPPKMEEVGISFDFARERALAAIGDIEMAASGARNIELGRMTVPGNANDRVLTGSDNARAAKRNADMIRIMAGNVGKDWKKTQEAISKQVSTIVTDFSRGIADIITNGGKVSEVFSRIGKQIANTLIRTVIENGINRVIEALTGKGGLTGALGSVGKVLGGVFGGGAAGAASSAVPAVSGVAMATMGTIPSVAGAAGSASSGIGSALAAANPVTAMVNAAAGVVSAVSAVISNFQFAAMNKTLDLIEKEVRYSQIHLLHLLEKNNEYLPKLKDIHDSMIRTEGRQMAMAGNNNVTINISATGDTRTLLDAITRELKQLGVIPA